jgi:hypothetical protein
METPHMLMSPDIAAILTGCRREIEEGLRGHSIKLIQPGDGRVLMHVGFDDTWNAKFAKLKQRIIDA